MKPETLSLKQAQRFMLSSQKLLGIQDSLLKTVEHLGYVQIDSLSVVERAHHHVLWTRCPGYQPPDLSELVRKRKVFEYWSHAASFLPMKDFRFSLPMKKEIANNKNFWLPRDPKLMKMVLKRIKEEGPLRSVDFKSDSATKKPAGWSGKPVKKALERLFFEGKLEVTKRQGFQKVYDLPERVIPSSVNTCVPSPSEQVRYLIRRTLVHHGLATPKEMGYLKKKGVIDSIRKELKEMTLAKEVVQVSVQGIEKPYYAYPQTLEKIPRGNAKRILILSPFDNFVIQRNKLKKFFDWDYQIECYVTEKKRKYGYFCLPVFQGTEPVARIDCKVNRKTKTLLVLSAHYEEGVDQEAVRSRLDSKLKAFSQFNGCEHVHFVD